MMGRIYAQAERVLAWLGEATEGSNLTMQTLRKFDDTESTENMSTATDWRADGQYDQDDLALVEMLRNREYWQRTWVIQEVLLAKELEIICGEYSVLEVLRSFHQTPPASQAQDIFGKIRSLLRR
jgi:hypothetical protein